LVAVSVFINVSLLWFQSLSTPALSAELSPQPGTPHSPVAARQHKVTVVISRASEVCLMQGPKGITGGLVSIKFIYFGHAKVTVVA